MNARGAGIALGAVFVALLAVPVIARRETPVPPRDAASVIIITPHPEQIRNEFGDGFARWHQAKFGTPATVIWSTPGGTTEIRRMLEAGTVAALRAGAPVGGNADLLFGGGSYEYEQMKKPLTVEVGGEKRSASVLEPVPFDDAWLREVYGDNDIGGRTLYDPGRAWFGCALSAFGIVYNAEGLRRLGLAAPRDWSALADPRLRGEVALANPAQSGSIASGMETILQREGWQLGWAILRRAAANARSVSASATRAPIDVAQGQAVEALCIDFYGRFQQQSVTDGGSPGRVGYVDPVGKTAVDPDPVAMLRGAPHAATARRFIEFALSVEGQRLWQYRPGTEGGPRWTGLRRLPARRSLYATEMSHFTDKVDPWLLATAIANPNPDFRAFVAPLFVAMAIDNRSLLREAWACIAAHPEYPQDGRVLLASEATDPNLRAMLAEFDALPRLSGPSGTVLDLSDASTLRAVRDGWIRGGWKDAGLWPANDAPADVMRRIFAEEIGTHLRAVIARARGSVQ